MSLDCSIICPARNEEASLPRLLASLRGLRSSYEVIVIDNLSTDGTKDAARINGATVIQVSSGTVGMLRNAGVAASRAPMIVFLDADMEVTDSWCRRVDELVAQSADRNRCIYGARGDAPASASWVGKAWNDQGHSNSASHVGTGNMLCPAAFFAELGGFDPALVTGEDYDLCERALRIGGSVSLDPELRVVHWGVPNTVWDVVRRERWHGTSDFRTLRTLISSRPAIATVVFLALNVLILAGAVAGSVPIAAVGVVLLVLLLIAGAQSRGGPAEIIGFSQRVALFYFYFLGRSAAMLRLGGVYKQQRVSVPAKHEH